MNWFSGSKDLGENPNSAMDNELIQANAYALEMGVFVDGASEINKLAKRFGLLRATMEGKFIQEVTKAKGKVEWVIEITKEEVESVAQYIGEHWETGPQGQDFYEDPSTLGTQPIKPDEISDTLGDFIFNRMVEALRAQLLEVEI